MLLAPAYIVHSVCPSDLTRVEGFVRLFQPSLSIVAYRDLAESETLKGYLVGVEPELSLVEIPDTFPDL